MYFIFSAPLVYCQCHTLKRAVQDILGLNQAFSATFGVRNEMRGGDTLYEEKQWNKGSRLAFNKTSRGMNVHG